MQVIRANFHVKARAILESNETSRKDTEFTNLHPFHLQSNLHESPTKPDLFHVYAQVFLKFLRKKILIFIYIFCLINLITIPFLSSLSIKFFAFSFFVQLYTSSNVYKKKTILGPAIDQSTRPR